MDLEYFTGGCIDSMEGLLFESSATTPYHFLNQAEVSPAPSEPMVGLDYGPLDVPLGVRHMQMFGVRYFMADTTSVIDAAKADPSLRLVATTGPWKSLYGGESLSITWDVFEVSDSAPVVGLRDLPAVVTGVGQAQSSWLPVAQSWYLHPARWDVELAGSGPAGWPRVSRGERPRKVPVVPAKVTDISEGSETISFTVDHTGSPVLVRTSYFPNWVASGAQGPWRVTPNLMVVVPTGHRVTLTYGEGRAGRLGLAVSAAGIVLLVAGGILAWRRRVDESHHQEDPPRWYVHSEPGQ
jgi:hypothetical protein